MKRYSRKEILADLQKEIDEKKPVIVTAAGIGITAKCQEIGGTDLILVDSLAKIRMMGSSSLAGTNSFRSAYDLMEEEINEIPTVVSKTPLIAGLMTTVDMYDYDAIIDKYLEKGFSGFCNSPSFGYNGKYKKAVDGDLKSQGYGYGYEVDVIRHIHERDILTMAYVYTPYEAKLMANAGADIIVCHLGLTKGGILGSIDYKSLDESIEFISSMVKEIKSENENAMILCSGGPLETADDVEYVLNGLDGYVAGFVSCSPSDRIPMETGITATIKEFKENKLNLNL